jgi:hypothetical protein
MCIPAGGITEPVSMEKFEGHKSRILQGDLDLAVSRLEKRADRSELSLHDIPTTLNVLHYKYYTNPTPFFNSPGSSSQAGQQSFVSTSEFQLHLLFSV